jgi:hypothetical protein
MFTFSLQLMKNRYFSFRKMVLLLVVAAASLTGCEQDNEPAAPNKTQLLTGGGPWHITTYTRSTGSAAPANYLNTVFPNACERDDRYAFSSNGTQIRTEGPTACSGNNSQTVVGTYPWNLNASQTQLTIGSTTFDIVQLNDDALHLRWTHTSGGVTVVDNVNYTN